MPNMGDKVCLNHTSIPATSRCTTCFKPICDDCIIKENDEDFCCQICLEKHKRTSENIELLKQRKSGGFLKKAIIILCLGGALYWAYNNQDKVKDAIDKGKKEINK